MTRVKDVMAKRVATVTPETTMKKLCGILSRRKTSGVPVVDRKGKLVGFVSERDIIAAVAKKNFLDRTAGDLMTRKLKTIGPDEPLTNASKIFSCAPYRQLPVVKNGKVVGVLTRQGVVQHMMGTYY